MKSAPNPPRHKLVRRYNIPGHVHFLTFSCYKRMPLLSNEVWKEWLGQSVREGCDNKGVALWAYVFMPEHVHLLVYPRRDPYRIEEFLHAVKKPLAERVLNRLKAECAGLLDKLLVTQGERVRFRFWQAGGGFDRNLWNMKGIIQAAEYCHWNPVKRKLVRSPEPWRWSSFRWLELGRRENEPLRVDLWDERRSTGPGLMAADEG